jgi:signal transduction histidine kinase
LSGAIRSVVQSHRWFGPFVQQQLPSTLAVLARSENVLAIALVVNADDETPYFAGDMTLIAFDLPVGDHVRDDVLQIVTQFTMQNDRPGMHGMFSENSDRIGADDFHSIVLMDRTETLGQMQLEARNRILIFSFGTLLLVAVGAVWQFTVRLAQAEGRTRVLQVETRHLGELGQAAAGLAHETRNPLGLIRGWTQRLIETGLPDGDQQVQAEAVLEECDRVTARINQFLAFARQGDVNLEPVAIVELIEQLKALLQSDLDAKQLSLITTGMDGATTAEADRDQFRQVLFNLLQNAIAFSPSHSVITISILDSKHGKPRRGAYRLEVADQGPGADKDVVDTLFDPYVTRRPGGTGLGLSIVRHIASAHDWDVGYEAPEEGGSVFWIDGIRRV